jgi:hypothetical protein
MQKVDGVESVRVSLNEGLTILDLKPGNNVTVAKLRQIIKDNGFVSKEAAAIGHGEPNGEHMFVVAGTGEQLALSAAAQKADGGWRIAVAAPKP